MLFSQGLVKEFELSVVLTKSRSGSFGFTITRSKLDNCYYIQEILDNPAKADGRLRAGDRLVTVCTKTCACTFKVIIKRVLLIWQLFFVCHLLPGKWPWCYQCGRWRCHDYSQVISKETEYDNRESSEQPGGSTLLWQPAWYCPTQDTFRTAGWDFI